MRKVIAEAKHEQFRQELVALVRKYGENKSDKQVLAIASYVVGQIIALQNKRTMTTDTALDIVAANIRQGNEDACAAIRRGEQVN